MSKSATNCFVLVSLFCNISAVAWVILSVPENRPDSWGVTFEELAEGIPRLIFLFLFTCGPWLLAFSNVRLPSERPIGGAFAATSLFTCLAFVLLRPSAPTEAISYHVVLYVPVVWGAYLVSWLACRPSKP